MGVASDPVIFDFRFFRLSSNIGDLAVKMVGAMLLGAVEGRIRFLPTLNAQISQDIWALGLGQKWILVTTATLC